MTYLDAAYTILKSAGQPLHYEEITARALAEKLISPQGLTPDATMGSRLYTDTKQEGSLFVRAGHGRFGLAQWQPKGIDARIEEINAATLTQLAQLVSAMPPGRFESLIRELLIQMGFDENTVNITPYSSDGGIDVTGVYRAAGLTDVNAAVQVKRWKGNVGAPVVTQLRGSLQVHQQGIIITTSDFSKSAREEASAPNKTRIGLIGRKELLNLLIKHKVGVVRRPLEVTVLDEEYWGELVGQTGLLLAPEMSGTSDLPPLEVDQSQKETKKPQGFTLLGELHTVNSWRGVLLGVCEVLAQRHGASFNLTATAIKGRKRQYIAPSPEGMISSAPIPGTGLWVETNQSAKSVMQLVEKLLTSLGHQSDELVIHS